MHQRIAAACSALAAAVGVVAGIGVFGRGANATRTVTSVRGETFEMVTEGIYAFNSERMVAEGIAWDVFTLIAAVPMMLVLAVGVARGSLRARLGALGLLAYFFYQYLMYATGWAFGPLFLPFVVLFASSLALIVWVASSIDLDELSHRCTDRFPLRAMAIFSLVMAAILVVMWTGRIVPALRGDLEGGMLLGQSTMVVQALDLGLVVPLAIWTGVAALRRRPLGYLLSAVVAVKGAAMASAIALMVIHAGMVEGSFEWVGLAIFASAATFCIWLCVRMWRSVTT